ncbi:MAG: dihydrofolate reductase family protein [Acidimicrobiia bacterium]|nr:dihydrofolate reductase family protein [Acidimicrobiia bacterium]
MRRVHPPSPQDTTIAEAYAAPLGTRLDRPWVGLSMATSLDGSTVVDGQSGGLGNANDAAVFRQLRSLADVIIVGSGTARAEEYGPPSKPGQRVGVVTASGRLDLTSELFTSGSGFVITTERTTLNGNDGIDVLRAGVDVVDLRTALGRLDQIHDGVSTVQAEGGSTLNGALLESDLIDEINVTTAPLVIAGQGPRLAAGADIRLRFDLAQLAIDEDGYVFGRWVRRDRT